MLTVNGLAGALGYKPQSKAPVAPVAEPAPRTETGPSSAAKPVTTPQPLEESATLSTKPAEPATAVATVATVAAPAATEAGIRVPLADAGAARSDSTRAEDGLVRDLPGAIAADLGAIAAAEEASRAAAEAARASIRTSLLVESLSIPAAAGTESQGRDGSARTAGDRYDVARPAVDTAMPERKLAKVA